MSRKPTFNNPAQGVELGGLLANTVVAIAEAQQRMDAIALERKREVEAAPAEESPLPPLWFVFDKVAVEVELSATIRTEEETLIRADPAGARVRPRLFCQTLNPTTVSLYGYEASAGLKVRLQLGPRPVLPRGRPGEAD